MDSSDFKRLISHLDLSSFFCLGLIITFFMPWLGYLGYTASGNEIGHMLKVVYQMLTGDASKSLIFQLTLIRILLYASPILALVSIIQNFRLRNTRIVATLSGFIPLLGFLIIYTTIKKELNEELPLVFGGYLFLFFAIGVIIAAVKNIKFTSVFFNIDANSNLTPSKTNDGILKSSNETDDRKNTLNAKNSVNKKNDTVNTIPINDEVKNVTKLFNFKKLFFQYVFPTLIIVFFFLAMDYYPRGIYLNVSTLYIITLSTIYLLKLGYLNIFVVDFFFFVMQLLTFFSFIGIPMILNFLLVLIISFIIGFLIGFFVEKYKINFLLITFCLTVYIFWFGMFLNDLNKEVVSFSTLDFLSKEIIGNIPLTCLFTVIITVILFLFIKKSDKVKFFFIESFSNSLNKTQGKTHKKIRYMFLGGAYMILAFASLFYLSRFAKSPGYLLFHPRIYNIIGNISLLSVLMVLLLSGYNLSNGENVFTSNEFTLSIPLNCILVSLIFYILPNGDLFMRQSILFVITILLNTLYLRKLFPKNEIS